MFEQELVLKGTELSEAVEEFQREQRSRIRYQLKITALVKIVLEELIRQNCSSDAIRVFESFKEALKKKRPSFKVALAGVKKQLEALGEWEKNSMYFDFYEMIKKKKSFAHIIDIVKPKLLELKRWSDWREAMYTRHHNHEEEMLEMLRTSVDKRPVWSSWLSQVRGMGLVLAAQVIGGFESALDPGETIATHFRTVSQMWAFAGLDVRNGKTPRREKGKKLTFNSSLRSTLLGRIFPSFLKQKADRSGYRKLYDKMKRQEERKYKDKGWEIVPAAKLPSRGGKRYEPEGIISVGHLHNRVRRRVMKIFVAHLWEECRLAEGLPAGPGYSYAFAVLKHRKSSYISPIRDKNI